MTQSDRIAPSRTGEVIKVPNTLRDKVGPRFGGVDAAAIAKAEAALKSLSSQFAGWLNEEIAKLEAARHLIHMEGADARNMDALYTHAHDLKGLGGTYEYPLITRIAGSLCKLMDDRGERPKVPLHLVDAHIDAIRAVVRDQIKDPDHPVGRALAQALEQGVRDYVADDKGSSTRP